MKTFLSIKSSTWFFYAGLVVTATSPVWGVEYFVNQDGSAHVHSAYLMTEILRGNPFVSDTYVLNSICVPNSSVHIILALLLQVFSAFTTTKIVVCGLFAGVVASVGWLRFATVGNDGLKTSLLVGAAIGFNWLWLVGFYNFIFSVIIFAFTLGLYWKWRQRINVFRAIVLVLLFISAYFSHIIGFAILAGSVVVLALSADRTHRNRTVIWTLFCLLPVVPLTICYMSMSADGSSVFPVWRSLAETFSLSNLFNQIRAADPFAIIGRTAFPFVEMPQKWFAIFTPALWMTVAIISLLLITVRMRPTGGYFSNIYFPFTVLFAIAAVISVFGPDDFGISRGGVIRERIVICGLIFFVPLFRAAGSNTLKYLAQACLVLVILFQTAALWDYALRADRVAREYVAAKAAIADVRSIASVTIYEKDPRFRAAPETQLNLFNSIGRNVKDWDNYEMGQYIFPVRLKYKEDEDFALLLTSSNLFFADEPHPIFAERLIRLDSALANDGGRIDALLVWGLHAEVDAVITRYFESEAYYESQNIRLFRRRK